MSYDAPALVPNLTNLPDDAMITRKQVSALTGFAVSTFRLWARQQKGPPVIRVEGYPRYRARDVRAWLASSQAA